MQDNPEQLEFGFADAVTEAALPPIALSKPSRASLAAAAAFVQALAAQGAVLIEPWRGVKSRPLIRCKFGHVVPVTPGYVIYQGGGACRRCSGKDPDAARDAFHARVTELGGKVLEQGWFGVDKAHDVECPAGHTTSVQPKRLGQGRGLGCQFCSGRDPALVEARFRDRLAELGATLLEPGYRGVPHQLLCRNNHPCSVRPGNLTRGTGICITCAGQDPAVAFAAFKEALTTLGATLLEPTYLGNQVPHRVRCSEGHPCNPRPHDVQRGQGICNVCAGHDPATAWAAFQARIAELGATLLEPVYLGSQMRHQAICAEGHRCSPVPAETVQGRGICGECAGKVWDVFYVVINEAECQVKFGITRGDPRPRLKDHIKDGFHKTEVLLTGLPGTLARDTENAVKAALRLAKIRPVRGLEYHDISALALILDIANGHLGEAA